MTFANRAVLFRIVRLTVPAVGVGLFLLLIVALSPDDPSDGEQGRVIDRAYWADEKWIDKQVRIHSVLTSHREDLDEASAWAIAQTILEESEKYSLDPMLVLAVIKVESRFQHRAVSHKGARGLMQILPFVGRAMVPKMDLKVWHGIKTLDDPILNIKIGVFYLSRLKKRFKHLELALTAYNRGPTELRSRLNRNGAIPLGYARKVLAAYDGYSRFQQP